MEISGDEEEISKFIDEVLSVAFLYRKLIKNPRKKIRGLSFNILLAMIVSSSFIAILKAFPILENYNPWLNFIVCVICLGVFSLGLVNYIKVKNKISEFEDVVLNSRLIVEKDFVEWNCGGEKYVIKSEDLLFILINKYSICFIQKNDSKSIAISTKYKNEIISICEDAKIIDNSDLY